MTKSFCAGITCPCKCAHRALFGRFCIGSFQRPGRLCELPNIPKFLCFPSKGSRRPGGCLSEVLYSILQPSLEINKDIATKDQVAFAEATICNKIVLGEHDAADKLGLKRSNSP